MVRTESKQICQRGIYDPLAEIVHQVIGHLPKCIHIADFEAFGDVFLDNGIHQGGNVPPLILEIECLRETALAQIFIECDLDECLVFGREVFSPWQKRLNCGKDSNSF